MFYYAMLNKKGIITSTYASPVRVRTSKYLVEITSKDMGAIGRQFWACSTDNVQYLNTTKSLSDKLEEIDNELSAEGGNVASLVSEVADVKAIAENAEAEAGNNTAAIGSVRVDIQLAKDRMDGIADQVSAVRSIAESANEKGDRLSTELAELSNEVGGVEDSVGNVSHRVGQLETDYTETKAKTEEVLKSVNTRIDGMQSGFIQDLADINEKIDKNDTKTQAAFKNFSDTFNGTVANLSSGIGENTEKIEALDSAVGDAQKSIANLVTATSDNAIGIQNLEAANTQQNAEITRINQNVEAVIHTVNDHESVINKLDAQVDSLTEATNDNTTAIQEAERSIDSLTGRSNNNATAIDNLRIDFERTSANLREDLDSSVEGINKNFQQVNENFDGVREDIAELTERQDRTDNSINIIWADIRIKEAEMADYKAETAENFDALDSRVSANAGDIASLIGSINNAESDISTVAGRVTRVENRATALENRATTLESSVATNKTNITSVTNKANTNATNISSLTTRMTTAEKNINTNKTDIAAIKADYLPKTGGTVSGDLDVTGVLRMRGSQAFFYNDTAKTMNIGTNNATTVNLAGVHSGGTMNVNSASFRPYNVVPRDSNSLLGNATYRWKGIYSQAAVNVSCDERLKKDIAETDRAELAEFISKLPVKTYKYKDDELSLDRIGLIAQDVIKADPKLSRYFVSSEGDGFYSLKPADLVFPLIAAVQKLQDEVDQLKK